MVSVHCDMVRFKAKLEKFGEKAEKTGWTYINVPAKIAQEIKPGNRKSFRVKGKIDAYSIKALAMVPMGDGDFIIAVNAGLRKAIGKIPGAETELQLAEDKAPLKISTDLAECFLDEPGAWKYFNELPPSHRNWYSNWVKCAKTEITKSKRIATVINACMQKLSFRDMMKKYRDTNSILKK